MKVSLLQGSFVQEIWNLIGKQAYLETIHPLVISNLYVSPHKSSAAVASVLLIGTSEELGVPITVNQVDHSRGFGFVIWYWMHKMIVCLCVCNYALTHTREMPSKNSISFCSCNILISVC